MFWDEYVELGFEAAEGLCCALVLGERAAERVVLRNLFRGSRHGLWLCVGACNERARGGGRLGEQPRLGTQTDAVIARSPQRTQSFIRRWLATGSSCGTGATPESLPARALRLALPAPTLPLSLPRPQRLSSSRGSRTTFQTRLQSNSYRGEDGESSHASLGAQDRRSSRPLPSSRSSTPATCRTAAATASAP